MIPEMVAKYIRSIRHSEKRAYANCYAAHLFDGTEEPVRPASLSFMGAQAVRMNLHDFRRETQS